MSKENAHHDIKAIIFDLGRVLVAIDNTVLVEKLFKGFDKNDPQLVHRTMRSKHMVEFNSGRMSPEIFHQHMCRQFRLEMDYDTFIPLWCSIFYPMNGMEEIVMQLRNKVKLGLLSDTDPVHWNHIITSWPWLSIFENPTLSFEIGIMKPTAQIYRKAAENVNTPPENCLYIDDLEDNVEGARTVGMTAIRFESVDQFQKLLSKFI